MRSGAWLSASVALGLACALPLGACSGGYSLAPTGCDEWCNVTKGGGCEKYYDPAGCVSSCEAAHVPAEECAAELDAVLACYRKHPNAVAESCGFFPAASCSNENGALGNCASASFTSGVGRR